jgi:hypothetical protein
VTQNSSQETNPTPTLKTIPEEPPDTAAATYPKSPTSPEIAVIQSSGQETDLDNDQPLPAVALEPPETAAATYPKSPTGQEIAVIQSSGQETDLDNDQPLPTVGLST